MKPVLCRLAVDEQKVQQLHAEYYAYFMRPRRSLVKLRKIGRRYDYYRARVFRLLLAAGIVT
jgi:hypothetical protein